MDLTINNFFRYYIFNICDKDLTVKQKRLATILSIAIGVLTIGLSHFICAVALYKRSIGITQNPKVSQVAQQTLPSANPKPINPLISVPVPKSSSIAIPVSKAAVPLRPVGKSFNYQLAPSPSKASYNIRVNSTSEKQYVPCLQGLQTNVNVNKIQLPANLPLFQQLANNLPKQKEDLNAEIKSLDALKQFLEKPSSSTLTKEIRKWIEDAYSDLKPKKAHALQLEKDFKDLEQQKTELKEDYSALSTQSQNDISNEISDISTRMSAKEAELKALAPLVNKFDVLEAYLKDANQALPDLIRTDLEKIQASKVLEISDTDAHITNTEVFLKTRSLADYMRFVIPKEYKNLPDFKSVPGKNLTGLLPVCSTTGVAPFYPTANMLGNEIYVHVVFDDTGTQLNPFSFISYNKVDALPIQGKNQKGQDLDWQVNPVSDAALQSLKESNPELIDDIMKSGLNILIMKFTPTIPMRDPQIVFKGGGGSGNPTASVGVITSGKVNNQNYSKSNLQGDLIYLDNSAMFVRLSGLACKNFDMQKEIPENIRKLAEEVTTAGDERLQSFVS